MANRRILACILATMIIIVAGCGKTNKTKSPTTESATNTVGVSVGTQEIPSENTPSVENTQTAEPTVDVSQSAEKTTPPTLVLIVDNTQSPSASEPTATVKPTATIKPTVAPTAKPTVKPTAQPTKAPTASATAGTPPYKYTKEEHRQIAAEVVKEINKLRNVQLQVLPGLTKYAEYRAKQLETNFAHDSADQKAASKALQYGKYTNTPPSQAVLDVLLQYNPDYVYEPSYFVPAAEAIYCGSSNAFTVADSLHRSTGHWGYVGSDEYLYIGVGVSEQEDGWGGRGAMVICVCVAAENTDLLK